MAQIRFVAIPFLYADISIKFNVLIYYIANKSNIMVIINQ